MPRIIVTTDSVSSELTNDTPVLLDEHVHSVHLSTSHAAAQLMERLAWAVRDAESAQVPERPSARARPERPRQRRRPAAREHARGVVAA
ncbi:MAG TPA: hypothetical protein VGY13_11680 [Solirubrobacteraceae bacterium]|jgi:hypothetical protein|nr:hypothetical protein [Solirubrobacteraceae bacterium]